MRAALAGLSLLLSAFAAAEPPQWRPAADLPSPRMMLSAHALLDGTALVAGGGRGGSQDLMPLGALLFDRPSLSWRQAGELSTGRYAGSTAMLRDGRVLITGGYPDVASAELFDPARGSWSTVDAPPRGRFHQLISALPDGRVLVAGGAGGETAAADAYLFDPQAGRWSPAKSLREARTEARGALLADGRYMATGGWRTGLEHASTEIFDPKSGRWTWGAAMERPRSAHSVTRMRDGRVLAAGGTHAGNTAEVYDPRTGEWKSTGPMPGPRMFHRAAPMIDGRVLVIGGYDGSSRLASTAVYDPRSNSWSAGPDMRSARSDFGLAVFPNGAVLVVGGQGPSGAIAGAELLERPQDIRPAEPALVVESPAVPRPAPPPAPPTAPAVASRQRPDDFALVVGVERYAKLPAAEQAERDAQAVVSGFEALGIPRRNIISLLGSQATASTLKGYVEEWLPRNTKPGSQVFVYYSGHGAPDVKTGEAYLVPWDGDPSLLKSTAYPLRQLYASLGRLKARSVVVALDACFSGAGGRSVLPKGLRPLVVRKAEAAEVPPKLTILAAASEDEATGTLERERHGIFTYHFLAGLSGGALKDGKVTAEGLYEFLKPRVQDDARRQNREQTPVLLGDGETVLRQDAARR